MSTEPSRRGAGWYRLPPGFRRGCYRLFSPGSFRGYQQQRREGGFYHPFDANEAIFVHIPKCAGTTICRFLFGQDKVTHRSIARYQLIFSPAEFERYFKFTFVRNPWDRLVSAYHFLAAGGGTEGDQRWAADYLRPAGDFTRFVEEWLPRPEVQRRHYFRPQHTYVGLPGAAAPAVDFVGRVETLDEDLATVCQRLGREPVIPGRVNRSEHRDYRDLYQPRTRRMAAEVYRRDLEWFGYEF